MNKPITDSATPATTYAAVDTTPAEGAGASAPPNTKRAAFRLRRTFGAVCLPSVFVVMIVGTALLDPLDDSANERNTLVQATGHASQIAALGWAEICTALLTLAGLLTVVGSARRRGAGIANATGVLAGIAVVGMVGIALNHFVVSGLTRSNLTSHQKIEAFTQFHHAGGAIIVFIMLGALGFVTAAITAWRSGLSHKLVLVPAVAFLVVSFAPGEVAEYASFAAGLVMAVWIARDLLRENTK
jgi:hypothetical protein